MPAISPVSRGGKRFARRPRVARDIGFQRVLRRDQRAHAAAAVSGGASIRPVGRRQHRHRVVEAARRAVAAPHVEHDRAGALVTRSRSPCHWPRTRRSLSGPAPRSARN
jgi:hypothetical protein